MIRGDLKGVWSRTQVASPPLNLFLLKADILIDQDGHARLADFGPLTVSGSTYTPASNSSRTAGTTTRWMSPERLCPDRFGFEDGRATKESDYYALGMVILEVLTGRVPFPRYNDSTVVMKVVDGEHPGRPQGAKAAWFTDDLWRMLERCWSPQPKVRPTAEAILEHFKRSSMAWKPLPSTTDEFQADSDADSQVDSDDDSQADSDSDFQLPGAGGR